MITLFFNFLLVYIYTLIERVHRHQFEDRINRPFSLRVAFVFGNDVIRFLRTALPSRVWFADDSSLRD